MSEDQAEMQKSMNLMMPILSAYISFAWPLALGVYWLFGSILGIGQQFLIDKLMAKDRQQNGNDEDKKLFQFTDEVKKTSLLYFVNFYNNCYKYDFTNLIPNPNSNLNEFHVY